jgi:DNA-directed RNA polymerase subunit RPC12/RpoP
MSKLKRVYCPRCGSLVGFQLEDAPKIEVFKYTVGGKKYPLLDLTKVSSLPLICRSCGYKFNLKGEKFE